MEIEVKKIDELDLKKWEDLLHQSPNSSFYHTYNWISLWKDSYSNFFPFFILAKENQEYLAGLPFVQIKKFGLKSFFSLPYDSYGGIIFSKKIDEPLSFFEKFLKFTKKFNLLRIQITDFYNTSAPLMNLGFNSIKVFTHIINLDELKSNWESFVQKKRGIAQAEKRGVIIKKISSFEEVERYFELVKKTSQRHNLKKPHHPFLFYQNIFSQLSKTDVLLWNLAYFEDKPVAGQVNFIFKDTIYYWDGASDETFWQYRPNDALFVEAINFSLSKNLSYYNLGASPPNAFSLIQFKESWGGVKKEYRIYEKTGFWGKFLKR